MTDWKKSCHQWKIWKSFYSLKGMAKLLSRDYKTAFRIQQPTIKLHLVGKMWGEKKTGYWRNLLNIRKIQRHGALQIVPPPMVAHSRQPTFLMQDTPNRWHRWRWHRWQRGNFVSTYFRRYFLCLVITIPLKLERLLMRLPQMSHSIGILNHTSS